MPAPGNSDRFQDTGQAIIEPGLYNYRNRAYAPQLGRFLQTDPIGYGDGPNLYGYVGGDPINAMDPFGLERRKFATDAECESAGGIPTGEMDEKEPGYRQCVFLGEGPSPFGGGGRPSPTGGAGGTPADPLACARSRARSQETQGHVSAYYRESWVWRDPSALRYHQQDFSRRADNANAVSIGLGALTPFATLASGPAWQYVGATGSFLTIASQDESNQHRRRAQAFSNRLDELSDCEGVR